MLKKIEQALANIAKHLPGYKHRAAQLEMINAVATTFANTKFIDQSIVNGEQTQQQGESILVIEGPTGVGKSLGYLLPAVIVAKALDKQLVVASATVTLQEQLANKDIPFLAKHAGLDISYAIAKGRGRYVCTSRLRLRATSPVQSDFMTENENNSSSKEALMQMFAELSAGTWSGDRDSLAKPISDATWIPITNDRHGCTKRDCADFSRCPFFAARAKLEEVDIIIANHDLLLADMAMGGGVILPEPSETFYCLDEAHHLADKAIQQFAAAHSIQGTLVWLEKIGLTVSKAMTLLKDKSSLENITNLAEMLATNLQDFNRAIENFPELRLYNDTSNNSGVMRFKFGNIPAGLSPICDNLKTATRLLHTTLANLQEKLRRNKAIETDPRVTSQHDRALSDLGFLIGRMENLVAVWTLFTENSTADKPPIAKWITATWQIHKNQREQLEYTISASPVSAAKILAERFWCRIAGAVLTSATLRSLGSFKLLLAETGLNEYPQTTSIALDSPFDFQTQGKLTIPPMKSDPKDPQAHTEEIIALLPTMLSLEGGNGALVLFSSWKQMHEVAQQLPVNLRRLLLIQGKQAKDQLLKNHFARIEENKPSILFGLASFAEGLDLPGNACNHLIIAKLPFAVPDDPVTQTLAEWMTQRGRNPFTEMTLPAACIKLTQAVGRLIRTETDTGQVTILDTRLISKPYGRLLLKSLPPFARG